MLPPYIIRREQRHKRRRRRSLLHIHSSTGLFPLHQAHHADNLEPKFSRRRNGLYRRTTCRTHIIDDHHARAFLAEAFDALPCIMLLLSFTDEKPVQSSARYSNCHNDGIGPHRESADSIDLPSPLLNFFEEDLPRELRATRIQRGRPA